MPVYTGRQSNPILKRQKALFEVPFTTLFVFSCINGLIMNNNNITFWVGVH